MTQIQEEDHLLTLFRICAFFSYNFEFVSRHEKDFVEYIYLPASNLIRYNSDPLAIYYMKPSSIQQFLSALFRKKKKIVVRPVDDDSFPISFWLRLLTSGFSYYYYRIITNLFQKKKKMTQFSDWIFVIKSHELIFFLPRSLY